MLLTAFCDDELTKNADREMQDKFHITDTRHVFGCHAFFNAM